MFDITGKPMRNWVLVEPEGVEGDDQLKGWVERATKFVRHFRESEPCEQTPTAKPPVLVADLLPERTRRFLELLRLLF